MNAQVALALDRTGACAPQFPALRVPDVESFEIHVGADLAAIWVTRSARSNASVTLQQLRDTKMVDEAIDRDLGSDAKFKILSSRQKGVFSLGGDLSFFLDCISRRDRVGLLEYATLAIDAIGKNLSGHDAGHLATVALVTGETQGGGFEAALSCHTIVAERSASFGFPESLFGLFPGMGGEQLLAARVGGEVAARIVRSANRYTAEFLFEIGVLDYLVDQGAGAGFVTRLLSRAQTSTSEEAQRMAQRQERLRAVSRSALEQSIVRWTDQALSLEARQVRTMKYIVEMQSRRVA